MNNNNNNNNKNNNIRTIGFDIIKIRLLSNFYAVPTKHQEWGVYTVY